ncbi:hypothetical protein ACIG0C_14100 [Kitasatospora aureofaciens]|uniref:Uncharacterized protein n=1 Tax=Kitasatospora aureofaciens TaxID=1894 RepID=A0A1E7N628_KITAU|nr:hypothetical protein [Kitasatospora aureofaciens]ARF80049.1 hypothetical protein B6264_15010 [Kitasatospora aureofaciens]OEV36104.1 hypothetical protein HS99_0031030 [Kitasatospora aureofaciens]UKZ07666.1 hypothetical protein BOQ63_027235 [Streptomyces viridifaciens]GGV02890.1 hypothetical protein GCM10010502_66960 [Kitasatospora aureofaciens]
MGELIAELMPLFADGFVRRWHVARVRRRLAAGKPVRVPCSARSERPGWQRVYVNGRLGITPGAAAVSFGFRVLGHVDLPTGGTFHEPEPDTWHSQDWAATAYQPPGGGRPVYLQVDSRYLPVVHLAFARPETQKV